MKSKKFSETKMIEDLNKLYHEVLERKVHYKIAAVAISAAKAIAMHRQVSLKLKKLAK